MKTILFTIMFMLVIGLSTGTAMACGAPISHTQSIDDSCWGSGNAGDAPLGTKPWDYSTDPNFPYGYGGGALGSCAGGLGVIWDSSQYIYVCGNTGGGGFGSSCSETEYEDWLYYYDYFYEYYGDFEASYYASLLSGCWP